jgi:hypothetical protein
MRKLHQTVLSLAGLALAAGTALSAAPPAGAATAALMDFPAQFSEGFIVNANSGMCLQPSSDDFFGNGDLVVQRPCNGTVAQAWELVPIGRKTFIDSGPDITHDAYRIVNAASGLCLDDRDGVSSNGATVQQWACNTTSTTMQWASWAIRSDSINLLIANRRAMLNRDTFVTLEVASGSTADNAPVQLFDIPGDPPAAQRWVYNPVG